MTTNRTTLRDGSTRIYKHCLGAFQCSVKGCGYVESPRQPLNKNIKYGPREPVTKCPKHPDKALVHIGCNCKVAITDKNKR